MHRSHDFTDAVRGGARTGTPRVVVHLQGPTTHEQDAARVGLVVSRAVGNAVERNLVKRRLRGLLAGRIADLDDGEKLVVRALPAARGATSDDLGRDLDSALTRARARRARAER